MISGSISNLIRDENHELVSKLVYEQMGFIQPSEHVFKATSKVKLMNFEEKIFEMTEGGTKLCKFTFKKQFNFADPEESKLLNQFSKKVDVSFFLMIFS